MNKDLQVHLYWKGSRPEVVGFLPGRLTCYTLKYQCNSHPCVRGVRQGAHIGVSVLCMVVVVVVWC